MPLEIGSLLASWWLDGDPRFQVHNLTRAVLAGIPSLLHLGLAGKSSVLPGNLDNPVVENQPVLGGSSQLVSG